ILKELFEPEMRKCPDELHFAESCIFLWKIFFRDCLKSLDGGITPLDDLIGNIPREVEWPTIGIHVHESLHCEPAITIPRSTSALIRIIRPHGAGPPRGKRGVPRWDICHPSISCRHKTFHIFG